MKNTTAGAKGTTTIAAPSATEKAKFQGARLKAIMENPLAHSLITRNDFRVAKGLEFHAILHEIPIEQIARFYGFDEQGIAEILYARKIKEQKPELYVSIEKKVKKECAYSELEKYSKHQLDSIFSEGELFSICKNNFPSLPVYKIPGEGGHVKNFLFLCPESIGNDDRHDFPILNFLAGRSFFGSTVLPLRIHHNIGKIVYSLIEQKKVDAIISFYANGHNDASWHGYENHLISQLTSAEGLSMKADITLKFLSLLKKIPKNTICTLNGGIYPVEFLNSFLPKVAGTTVN